MPKKTHFPVLAKNFRRPWMKLKKIVCHFPNPWTLRVSGMGGYTSKCGKKVKITAPYSVQYRCEVSFSLLWSIHNTHSLSGWGVIETSK
jgi:hypothetical protein